MSIIDSSFFIYPPLKFFNSLSLNSNTFSLYSDELVVCAQELGVVCAVVGEHPN